MAGHNNFDNPPSIAQAINILREGGRLDDIKLARFEKSIRGIRVVSLLLPALLIFLFLYLEKAVGAPLAGVMLLLLSVYLYVKLKTLRRVFYLMNFGETVLAKVEPVWPVTSNAETICHYSFEYAGKKYQGKTALPKENRIDGQFVRIRFNPANPDQHAPAAYPLDIYHVVQE